MPHRNIPFEARRSLRGQCPADDFLIGPGSVRYALELPWKQRKSDGPRSAGSIIDDLDLRVTDTDSGNA